MNSFSPSIITIKEEIDQDEYFDLFENLHNSLRKFIRRKKFIDNNAKIEVFVSQLIYLMKGLANKLIEDFGDPSKIIRYCLKKFYNNQQHFSAVDLQKKIRDEFIYIDKTHVSTLISNDFSTKTPPKLIKTSRGRYYVNPASLY